MADEMGKPIKQGMVEIIKCIRLCEYYLNNSEQFLSNKYIKTESFKSYIAYCSVGLVLGIMPWNFPFCKF